MMDIRFTDADVTDDDGLVIVDLDPPSNVSIEEARAIWAGVILRTLRDAAGLLGSSIKAEKQTERDMVQRQALEFFARADGDMRAICAAAGINANAAREAAMRTLNDEGSLQEWLWHRKTVKGLGSEARG